MTPEEQIESIRCDLRKGGLYKEELRARCELLLAHIDAKAAQIEALKEKLITETAYHLYYKCQGDCCRMICSAGSHKEEARQQLKADPDLQAAGVKWE